MGVIDAISSIGDAINGIVQGFVDVNDAVISALSGLVSGLDYVDEYIVNMKSLNVYGENSYPVVQAVATVKYLIPADLFYFIYLFILFGITLTIYKIVAFLLTKIADFLLKDSGGFSASSIISGFTGKFLH